MKRTLDQTEPLSNRIGVPPQSRAALPDQGNMFGGGSRGGKRNSNRGGKKSKIVNGRAVAAVAIPTLPLPIHDKQYIVSTWPGGAATNNPKFKKFNDNAKGVCANYMTALGLPVIYKGAKAKVGNFEGFRVTVIADPEPPAYSPVGQASLPPISVPVIGTGDAATMKDAEKLAALHACIQLHSRNLLTESNLPIRMKGVSTPLQGNSASGAAGGDNGKTVALSGGQRIGLEEARAFMDYYCQKYRFGKPELTYTSGGGGYRGRGGGATWSATLLVDGKRIGMGEAKGKKDAMNRAYLDTAQYLEDCDKDLWRSWTEKKTTSMVMKGAIPAHVVFEVDSKTDEELRETVWESKESHLYKRAMAMVESEKEKAIAERERVRLIRSGGADNKATASSTNSEAASSRKAELRAPILARKSEELQARLRNYQTDPRVEKLRNQRLSLPVASHATSVLAKIATSSVVVVLAATGSGKTTQVPQLILDDWILRGDGAKCNIVCTQPRRIAAISVAERVAAERGEKVGDSVGYQVRFESKPPKSDGSILFCTTGLFLRRLQSDLSNMGNDSFLDGVTHVAVDEVHERDVDTDLLLFVLRRLLHERRRAGKAEIRVILMSATIDPTLFTNYFADPDTKMLAPVIEVPGRSFPVDKHFLDSTVKQLQDLRLAPNRGGWVWQEKSVYAYLQRELVNRIEMDQRTGRPIGEIDDLDMPYPLIALIIAWVLSKSDEGHVLVFLPGWDEIKAVQGMLQDRSRYPLFDVNFGDQQYEIHVLHSTVPIAEQQAVFEPPAPGIRRIVLSTNIAETSVTIPDVVFVVDSAKCKEKRYDPERRLSQLVSAWTGTSNVLQRAGRAGRHRPGEYYGIVSDARFAAMDIHQTVEMLRTDLANTCMHITGLQLPGLTVENVLSSTIQPPEAVRVSSAMTTLKMVGAIDRDEKLTSLGKVLLQLPVEAAIGKLCLLGSFFRCLEQTLTLAAILTNRDPFLSPILLKAEADRVKNSWTPTDFRSDPLAVLSAFNVWWGMQSRGDYVAANRFCSDNFLSKPTLLMIQKIKEHILQSLDKAGVLRVSGGADDSRVSFRRGGTSQIPESLNVNGESLPLLSALVAAAVAPNFAIRTSEKSLRTSFDKTCAIHPSSVNSRKNEKAADLEVTAQKQLYAFAEKSKTGGIGGKSDGQMFLRGTTRLDPLGYMLFGASTLRVTETGLECDSWLPIVGNVSALDDVERLKDILDLSLLRVFEGINSGIGRRPVTHSARGGSNNRDRRIDEEGEGETEQENFDMKDPTLTANEVTDLDRLTTSVVKVLNMFAESRESSSSRPETPHPPQGAYSTGPAQNGPIKSFNSNSQHQRFNSSSAPATRAPSDSGGYDSSRPASAAGKSSYSGGYNGEETRYDGKQTYGGRGGSRGGRGGRGGSAGRGSNKVEESWR